VEVAEGIVTLAGHVDPFTEKLQARRILQRVAVVSALAIEIDVSRVHDSLTHASKNMKLARFLIEHAEPILAQWQEFARTLVPSGMRMTDNALRDHALQMLQAIALDIESTQSPGAAERKSHSEVNPRMAKSAAALHGALRVVAGFTLLQLTSEFRALRATVLRLWLPEIEEFNQGVHEEIIRFNEAVDQALAESVAHFTEEGNRSRDRFLAILGHDLRAPLSAISMIGGVLEMSSVTRTASSGEQLVRSAATMSAMVNDLLEYSRTQLGGKMPMSPRPCDAAEICSAALDDAKLIYPECLFELKREGATTGIYDAVRLQQVVANLLMNAALYHQKGTSVGLALNSDDDRLTISVTNFGPVIPADKIASIFDAMVQLPGKAQQRARSHTSMGLGLFIAKQTTLAHGGKISVHSNERMGTIFNVTIPRAPLD
jgi:signal transduction histidine kinase